jgi:hypothetical protein
MLKYIILLLCAAAAFAQPVARPVVTSVPEGTELKPANGGRRMRAFPLLPVAGKLAAAVAAPHVVPHVQNAGEKVGEWIKGLF